MNGAKLTHSLLCTSNTRIVSKNTFTSTVETQFLDDWSDYCTHTISLYYTLIN